MKGQFMFSFIVHIVRMKKGLWIFLIFHISRKRWISCGWLKNIGDEYLEQIEGEIWNYILAFQTWETYTSLMAGRRDQRNHTYCRVQRCSGWTVELLGKPLYLENETHRAADAKLGISASSEEYSEQAAT